ncbi:MAG: translocation/assembly module TamB domain-containing protein [Puia sp.]|nr:translocation/assembly module TamB domain-containing protein [Puia sp.]
MLVLVFLLVALWSLVQMPPVQTWLIARVTGKLSKNLHTTIRVRHVDFSLFNKMLLEGALVEDADRDTLLYAGRIRVNITDWFIFKDSAELHYVGIEDAVIKLHRKDSVWNYQFLADYFSGPKKTDPKQGITLNLQKLELSHIHFLKKDEWRGEDMNCWLTGLDLVADTFNFTRKIARIGKLTVDGPRFSIGAYTGRRTNPPDTTENIKNDPLHLRWNTDGWDMTAASIVIRDGTFTDDKLTDSSFNQHFDGHHINFHAVNWDFKNVRVNRDTITAQIQLSTKERSGFEVKKLSARVKLFPEAMEFSKLDLQTNKSHLRNYFAMRFRTFDDMSDFETRVRMEADFSDAEVNSDDIAFFAPELKDWKKNIRLTGHAQGTIDNLHGRSLVVEAGKNTYLNGDIHLRGLSDINTTYIEFKSNDFRTTYKDMVTLVPELKTVTQPRIDRIEYLRFRGSFTGYVKNFVTNGIIETNFGTVITDVNMKLPDSGPSVYSGNINTDNFDMGAFMDNDNLGKISFKGVVSGSGLKSKSLNATLDGTIQSLEFNNYTYQNIQVKGTVAKKKFNGQLVSSDPNLDARLNGLIDFSEKLPKFDFYAEVAKADLTKLHFAGKTIEFNGKFRFNFSGDNIDNFLGTARIYDASVLKNGERVSFDSLNLESSIIDNNKTITVVSNEFDGAIVGEFSIKDLPASFQTFLNKYYPSYIKPANKVISNQNFSFVITTKKVDEYIDLFNTDLKGFNNTAVSGRIDTRENLLDLNVDLPQFGYKNISFNNLSLKGRGNLDSLFMETTIGDVLVNDSLHFPGTHIQLHSANDVSRVQIATSANQTLNSASISAQVQTLPTGFRIRFNPSTFDVNSKTWTIDKDGELEFNNNIVSARDLKISSGDQQMLVTTHPSQTGNWNDVHVDLKKINIGDFTPYLVKSVRIEGLLTGAGDLTDPFGKPAMSFSGTADQFRFENDSIGKLQLNAGYDKSAGLLKAVVQSDNKNYHFNLNGSFSTLDSLAENSPQQPVNITSHFENTQIALLEKYLGGIFTNVSGFATGDLQIIGTSGDQLKYLGNFQLKDAGLKVAYTQCYYKIPDAAIQFKDGYIDFGNLQLTDKFGHTASLTRGKLYHHGFDDLSFDFALNTKRMLLLDTKATDNNQFYGTVIGKAEVDLKGPEENMLMNIKGEPTDSSSIYLPPSVNRESGEADFIVWKVYGKEMKGTGFERKGSNLTASLTINANNYANVYVIVDPLTGDIIKANGHGLLQMRVGTSEDLTMNGRYEIDRGSYNFTFQSFLRKPFVLSEGAGNYIQWAGDPYDANINIEAIYKAENISFNDLGYASASSGVSVTSENVKRYRGEILVIADLTGKLLQPHIGFQIELPPNSQLTYDQDAQGLLQKIQSDPNELNKQVSYLVVINSFGPLSNTTNFDASTAFTGIVVNSISGMISNVFSRQFSNIFQKIFNDKSIRVNFNTTVYNGSNLIDNVDQSKVILDRTNLNFSIGKSFLNEKLSLNLGSALDFGMTAQQVQASSFQFLPDITAEYKLTADGRIALTLFYRDSYNYLSAGNRTQNSSGTSISYRRDFDRIDELFKKKKKKEKPVPPPPPPPPPTPAKQAGVVDAGSK